MSALNDLYKKKTTPLEELIIRVGNYAWEKMALSEQAAMKKQAAEELAQLRAERAKLLTDLIVETEEGRMLAIENGKLRTRLDTACHIKAKDKESFDWKVLDKLAAADKLAEDIGEEISKVYNNAIGPVEFFEGIEEAHEKYRKAGTK